MDFVSWDDDIPNIWKIIKIPWFQTTTTKYIVIPITSSTAQGGGGSFKNRKPIGEVGCCESGMAERSH